MKQIKKFVPKVVALLLCCALILPVSAAGLPEEGEVLPLSYNAVAEYISAATETRVGEVNGETVTYYFGDGFGERREGEKGGREGSGCGERSGAFVESVEVAAGGDARDGSGFGDVDGGDEARPKLLRIVENDVFAL